ncbi:AMP-binding protein [Nocardia terrae]|uniref:AMP-binding protein n=1 Tax=Nocardia terrae TaxID=2675851 RepID=UPI002E259F8A
MIDPANDEAAVRHWLISPSGDTGIHLADEGEGWAYRSYRELADQVWSITGLLRANGLDSGDGACVIMPTGFPCVAAFYAVWACGGVFTPVAPPMFGDLEQIVAHIAGILEQARPKLVVTSPEFETFVRAAAVAAGRADEPLVVDAAALPAAPAARELAEVAEVALLQFTSGSSGSPRGVRVSWHNLANNIDMITRLIDWQPGESMVSWLPLYHDMGLVGAFLQGVTNQADLYLMRPDQFVRDPIRWLRAMTTAQHAPSPSFALGYVAHRVRPEDIADLDLSGWRTLAIGSEPVEVADLQAFAKLTGPQGFSMGAFTLAYGLAEATLMVTSSPTRRPITALRLDNPNLRFGEPVPVLEEAILDDSHRVEGAGWITGLGFSTPESTVTVVDDEGRELPDGVLGEMVVTGDSVALGYSGTPSATASTRIENGRLYSGDAGFLYDGEVFVLGRMGTSLKVRGRSVFMEDIESRVAQETGLTKGKLAAVGFSDAGQQGVVLFAETAAGDWIAQARAIIRGHLGPAQLVRIVTGPRGLIRRTSSGKPRRRHMWQQLRDSKLEGAVIHAPDDEEQASARTPAIPADRLKRLLDAALEAVSVPADAAVLFEGSLAEGFGNAGSDIDFLVVAPGCDELPTLPTVLFLDGRRVEVRTRSVAQIRRQFEQVITDPNEDVLNRCQRFLRATVLVPGVVDLYELRALITDDAFAVRVATWWTARARHALRYAIALRAFGAHAEALAWAEDGVLQATKGWLAHRDETYLETKWLPRQLDRIGPDPLADRYRALIGAPGRANQSSGLGPEPVSASAGPTPAAERQEAETTGAATTRHPSVLLPGNASATSDSGRDRTGAPAAAADAGNPGPGSVAPERKSWAVGTGNGGEAISVDTIHTPDAGTTGEAEAKAYGQDAGSGSLGDATRNPGQGSGFGEQSPTPGSEAGEERWGALLELAADLGVDGIADDAHALIFTRRPQVTTWPLAGRLHVLRSDGEVFVLSEAGARAWRSVVFRQSVRDVMARSGHEIGAELAEFVRLGFVGLQWRGGEVLEPALAMCKPVQPFTPVPAVALPALGLTGAARGEGIVTLSPMPAQRFIGCGLNLVWSNVVLENAREDLVGAVKDGQGEVADIAAHRLIAMSVRVLLSAYGIDPLPADVDPVGTVARLVPAHAPDRTVLLSALESAVQVRFSRTLRNGGDALDDLACVDGFVATVRRLSADAGAAREFPASFDSREQWQRTLTLGYDWLRLAGYLDADLPLDEARDLLASGGQQPHLRESEQS